MRKAWRYGLLPFLVALWLAPTAWASDPASRAIENEPRIWRALSGDRLELDGTIFRLHGVRCPDLDEEAGRDAKALLNTFLRGGDIACRVWRTSDGPQAQCAKEGRDIATGMVRSGLCRPYRAGPRQEAAASDPVETSELLRLGAAPRDRRQFLDNLCNPRSAAAKPNVPFFNRCPEEVLRNAVDAAVDNQLNPDRTGLSRRDPFAVHPLSHGSSRTPWPR